MGEEVVHRVQVLQVLRPYPVTWRFHTVAGWTEEAIGGEQNC
jgi:hypothetical protein